MNLLQYFAWLFSGNANKNGPTAVGAPQPKPIRAPGSVFDDFDGAAGSPPDANLWFPEGDWHSGISDTDTANAVLDGAGNLVLSASKVEGSTRWSSALVSCRQMLGFGTFYASIKMPAGKGIHPTFWSVGETHDHSDPDSWPACGETDITEHKADGKYHTFVHGPMYGGQPYSQSAIHGTLGFNPAQGYHLYWVKRAPGMLTFGIDATTIGKIGKQSIPGGAPWVMDMPQKVILSVTVGGYAGNPTAQTPSPTAMLVDWFYWEPQL